MKATVISSALLLVLTLAVACAKAPTPDDSSPTPIPAVETASQPVSHKNTLRWANASEVDNFGFDVFRGDTEDGPFEKINPEIIPGAGTTDTPTKYSYADETIDPTRAYYYYVESISMSGERQRATPIIRAKPKLPVEDG